MSTSLGDLILALAHIRIDVCRCSRSFPCLTRVFHLIVHPHQFLIRFAGREKKEKKKKRNTVQQRRQQQCQRQRRFFSCFSLCVCVRERFGILHFFLLPLLLLLHRRRRRCRCRRRRHFIFTLTGARNLTDIRAMISS